MQTAASGIRWSATFACKSRGKRLRSIRASAPSFYRNPLPGSVCLRGRQSLLRSLELRIAVAR
jgi:hypothetical protein